MSGPPKPATEPVESIADLVAYLERGCRPRAEWRIGTEHEKFVYDKKTLRRPGYHGPSGIEALLQSLAECGGYERIYEAGAIVALLRKGEGSITYEPGGQLELSGAPLRTLHETCCEVYRYLEQVKRASEPLGVGLLGIGVDPKWRRDEVPWMPKPRYELMREYMPKVGKLGLDMMLRTCTVQVNLDFSSEADMVKKLRLSLALQPVVTAIFANSPFSEGKPNGFLSYRQSVWTDTDPDRTGALPFAFEAGMGFERYIEYALDVPMYFVYRDGKYINALGQSFRDFLAGNLPALPGEKPTIGDFEQHLTTLFPDVRLKKFLEQRGADGGPWKRICALPALWVGLLYDDAAMDAAWDLVKDWTAGDRQTLRMTVPRQGLHTLVPRDSSRMLSELANDILALSRAGLDRRNHKDKQGRTEAHFLEELQGFVDAKASPARQALRKFEEEWGGDISRVYSEMDD